MTLTEQIAASQARLDELPPRYREALMSQMKRALEYKVPPGPDLSTPEGQVRDCGGW